MRELQYWELPQRGFDELRQEYGVDLSDEDCLLRVLRSNQDAVDEVLAAGPARYHDPTGDKPVLALVGDLIQRQDVASVRIQKGELSLTLR